MRTAAKNIFLKKVQEYHAGQFDSQGVPYWLHPYRVSLQSESFMNLLSSNVEDHPWFDENPDFEDQIFLVGLYHDVLEDVPGSWESVKEDLKDFPGALRSVALLTKPSQWTSGFSEVLLEKEMDQIKLAETYEEKIDVMSSIGDVYANVVKYHDNQDNSLPWRSKTPGRPTVKYIKSKILLEDRIKEFFDAN